MRQILHKLNQRGNMDGRVGESGISAKSHLKVTYYKFTPSPDSKAGGVRLIFSVYAEYKFLVKDR